MCACYFLYLAYWTRKSIKSSAGKILHKPGKMPQLISKELSKRRSVFLMVIWDTVWVSPIGILHILLYIVYNVYIVYIPIVSPNSCQSWWSRLCCQEAMKVGNKVSWWHWSQYSSTIIRLLKFFPRLLKFLSSMVVSSLGWWEGMMVGASGC